MSENNNINESEKFYFSFGGKNSIDAVTYIDTMREIVNLLQITAKAYNPDLIIKVDINAHQEGSFESVLEAVVSSKDTLLEYGAQTIPVIRNIVGSVKDIFDIRKHCKGEKPKAITQKNENNMEITNKDNEIIEKSNISTNLATKNKDVDKAIVSITNNIIINSRENFKIKTSKDGSVEIKSTEYQNLNKSIVDNNVIVNENNDKTIIGNEYEDKLIVITQTVNNSSEWQFEDGEDIINVNIKDEEFLKKYSLQEIPILPRAVFKVIRRVDKINKNNKIKKIHYIIKVINYDEKEINLFT